MFLGPNGAAESARKPQNAHNNKRKRRQNKEDDYK